MSSSFRLVLTVLVLTFACSTLHSQQKGKTETKPPEIMPRRPECGILLPERGERNDVARLIRADQFIQCERDGFPKALAPPWKETEEAEKKLGDACEYFAVKSAKEFPEAGQENLKLAADRCRINVMQIILSKMVEGLGQPAPK